MKENLIPYIYNKINYLESQIGSPSAFDPSTYSMKGGAYYYDPLLYSPLSLNATISSTAVFPCNFSQTNSFSLGGASFGSSLFYIDATTYITKPTLTLSNSTIGASLANYRPYAQSGLGDLFPFTITNQIITYSTVISFDAFGTQAEYCIGIGAFSVASNTWGGNGIFFNINTNANSGLLRIGRVASGIKTFYDTALIVNTRTPYEFKIVLNKKTNIASFYLNGVDIGLTIDITTFDNLYLTPAFIINSLSSLGSGNRRMAINSIYVEQKY